MPSCTSLSVFARAFVTLLLFVSVTLAPLASGLAIGRSKAKSQRTGLLQRRVQSSSLGINLSYDTSQFEVEADAARGLAAAISSMGPAISPKGVQHLMTSVLYIHEGVYGGAIAFEPDSYPCTAPENGTGCTTPSLSQGVPSASGYDENGNSTWQGMTEAWTLPLVELWPGEKSILYSPYSCRGANWVEGVPYTSMDLADTYNYWEGTTEWYHAPRTKWIQGELNFTQGHWTEPYYDEGAGNVEMVSFAVPFWRLEPVEPKSHPNADDATIFPHGFAVNTPRVDFKGDTVYLWGVLAVDFVLNRLTFDCGDTEVYDSELKACRNCSAGTERQEVEGSSPVCVACAAGRYSLGGDSTCTDCPFGTYQASTKASFCNSCGEGETTGELQLLRGSMTLLERQGSVSSDECACIAGSTTYGDIDVCHSCGEGLSCAGGSEFAVLPGYWVPSDRPFSVFACDVASYCPGGAAGKCAEHRSNRSLACSECLPGYKPASTGACNACGGMDYWLLPLCGCVGLLGLIGIYYLSMGERTARQWRSTVLMVVTIGQVVTMLQQLTVMDAMAVAWPEPLAGLLNFMSVLAFDINMMQVNCFVGIEATLSFSFRLFSVLGLFFMLGIIHTIIVAVFFNCKFYSNRSHMYGCSGTLFITLLVPILTALIAPLQCKEHPNGLATVISYPSVVCWSEDFDSPHSGMVVLSLISCAIPVAVFAVVLYVVWILPSKLRQGDSAFLQCTTCLFFRFRMETHWFVLVFIARNALISLVPVIPDAATQVIVMSVVLVACMLITVYVLPWRVSEANALDVGCCCAMLMFLICSGFFIDDVSGEIWATFSLILVVVLLVVFIFVLAFTFQHRMMRKRKAYHFFLCHHKEGAGNFARLLKLYLLEHRQIRGDVFLDSDNLADLAALYNIVRTDVNTVLILCSRLILHRPWCVGEMTIATLNRIERVAVNLDGFEYPDASFVNAFEHHISDWSPLSEHGISLEAVKDMLSGLPSWPQAAIPLKLGDKEMTRIAASLVRRNALTAFEVDSTGALEAAEELQEFTLDLPHCCGLLGQEDPEAICALLVVKRMLPPFILNTRVYVITNYLSPSTSAVVLACSNGIFHSQFVLETLQGAKAIGAGVVPVTVETNFRFPGSHLEQELLAASFATSLNVPMVAEIIREVFRGIAININVQEHIGVLAASCDKLTKRLMNKEYQSQSGIPNSSWRTRGSNKSSRGGSEAGLRSTGSEQGPVPSSRWSSEMSVVPIQEGRGSQQQDRPTPDEEAPEVREDDREENEEEHVQHIDTKDMEGGRYDAASDETASRLESFFWSTSITQEEQQLAGRGASGNNSPVDHLVGVPDQQLASFV